MPIERHFSRRGAYHCRTWRTDICCGPTQSEMKPRNRFRTHHLFCLRVSHTSGKRDRTWASVNIPTIRGLIQKIERPREMEAGMAFITGQELGARILPTTTCFIRDLVDLKDTLWSIKASKGTSQITSEHRSQVAGTSLGELA